MPDEQKELLRQGGFSVGRTSVPMSRTPIDLTIEQTINRHAKTKGGLIGFSTNRPVYYRWVVTRHNRASYVEATHSMAETSDNTSDSHQEMSPARIRQSETQVQNTITAISGFINPFSAGIEDLVCISSGIKLAE